MDYSNIKYNMVLPDYGVNIQKMIDHAVNMENAEDRLRAAHAIIQVMGNLFPHLKNTDDKRKLWDHLAIMSKFKLNIEYPCELTSRENIKEKPEKIYYNNNRIKLKHYGLMIEKLINAAIEELDLEKRKMLAILIANQMKMSYLTWNKDSVEDQLILDDLRKLSNQVLDYTLEEITLLPSKDMLGTTTKPKNTGNNTRNNKKNKVKSKPKRNHKE